MANGDVPQIVFEHVDKQNPPQSWDASFMVQYDLGQMAAALFWLCGCVAVVGLSGVVFATWWVIKTAHFGYEQPLWWVWIVGIAGAALIWAGIRAMGNAWEAAKPWRRPIRLSPNDPEFLTQYIARGLNTGKWETD